MSGAVTTTAATTTTSAATTTTSAATTTTSSVVTALVPIFQPFEAPTALFCQQKGKRWERRGEGQFLTPLPVALYMATLAASGPPAPGNLLRVLDAGAGLGILSCAFIDLVVSSPHSSWLGQIRRIELVMVEADASTSNFLRSKLEEKLAALNTGLRSLKIDLTIKNDDFLNIAEQWISSKKEFDIVLSNPPYFKLNSNDPRVVSASRRVGKQSNIYSLFMSYAAELLRRNGMLAFITPRSFASGSYFKCFREHFLGKMSLVQLHVFESRTDAFEAESVLQENVIVCAKRKAISSAQMDSVTITASNGVSDLQSSTSIVVPSSTVLWRLNDSEVPIIRFPLALNDIDVCDLFSHCTDSLQSLGVSVATGPAVAFRCSSLTVKNGKNAWPFLWMEHIQPLTISWPSEAKKSHNQYVKAIFSSDVKNITVQVQNMVIIRRFSAKEQKRRLIVSTFLESDFSQYPRIAIENHLNFITSATSRKLSSELCAGISAFLSSALVDSFFRVSSGNTQVNASELRSLPFPSAATLCDIGNKILPRLQTSTSKQLLELCDSAVATELQSLRGGGAPKKLRRNIASWFVASGGDGGAGGGGSA